MQPGQYQRARGNNDIPHKCSPLFQRIPEHGFMLHTQKIQKTQHHYQPEEQQQQRLLQISKQKHNNYKYLRV